MKKKQDDAKPAKTAQPVHAGYARHVTYQHKQDREHPQNVQVAGVLIRLTVEGNGIPASLERKTRVWHWHNDAQRWSTKYAAERDS